MTRPDSTKGAAVCFAEARVAAEHAEAAQQRQAARRVAEHSRDVDDCRDLLLMLGLAAAAGSRSARQDRVQAFPGVSSEASALTSP
ncbi:hypothetical protein AB0A63_03730 [Lentzea sp. NPDC042327]|uniref:hypothetical protein n=1 Tax=Lentzea sp. NPDC042327 TaxID=3154801 RepID=UPI0033FA6245